jgi:AcrR family transcriptional regulator
MSDSQSPKQASKPTKSRAQREKERKERIIDVAVRLAEEGGFENVRQRDIAAQAGVALGTLYKSFRGKEDILSAALERETQMLEQALELQPIQGSTPLERVGDFFDRLTNALLGKPNYARAIIRAMCSCEPEVAGNVVAYQTHVNGMILTALRGSQQAGRDQLSDETAFQLALILQQLWFAAMIGWSAGLYSKEDVSLQVRHAAQLLLAGASAMRL